MAAAKKKANRRALFIVIGALVAAILIWVLVANKAIQDKKDAMSQTEALKGQIEKKKDSLLVLSQSIESSRQELKKIQTDKEKPNETGTAMGDSAMRERILADSTKIDSLNSLRSLLAKEKSDLEKMMADKDTQITVFTNTQKKSDATLTTNKKQIDDLQRQVSQLKVSLAAREQDYKFQIASYNDYVKQVSHRDIVVEDTSSDVSFDTSSVHVNLSFGPQKGKATVPKNLRVYLMPDDATNKAVIKKAKVYEMYCDELNLDKAKGKKIARYKDGVYKFYNVQPGKYFVKICAYYGGFYSFTKSVSGNAVVKFDASPPVQ